MSSRTKAAAPRGLDAGARPGARRSHDVSILCFSQVQIEFRSVSRISKCVCVLVQINFLVNLVIKFLIEATYRKLPGGQLTVRWLVAVSAGRQLVTARRSVLPNTSENEWRRIC